MIVNFKTQNDCDFIRAFVLSQAVAAWDAGTFYSAGAQVSSAGRVWNAVADNTGVTPGTDATKWTLGTAPAIDLTGSRLEFKARNPVSAATLALSATSDDSIDVTNAAGGAFTLRLPFDQLKKMVAGDYEQSLIQINAAGERILIWHGTITHAVGAAHV